MLSSQTDNIESGKRCSEGAVVCLETSPVVKDDAIERNVSGGIRRLVQSHSESNGIN